MRILMALLVLSVACSLLSAQTASNMTGRKTHPCVLVNADALPLLKAKAADLQPNRFGFKTGDLWAAIRQQADRLAALPTYHYRVECPGENNVKLDVFDYTLSDATPPKHDNSPAYPPWTAMFQERADSLTTRLVHFSFAYLVTGEPSYFEKAKEIALHLTHWEQWTDPSYGRGAVKACLDTGHCTYAMGMFYDWCFGALTEAERTQVREAIIAKGIVPALGYVDHYPPDTNGYAVITAGAGLAALAVRPEAPQAGEYLQQAIDKTRVSLGRGGKDGGMFEGPMYGTYLMDSFAIFLDGLVSADVQQDLFDHPYLKTMDRYCVGMLAPDTKQIPCFSDGSPGTAVPQLMAILAQRGSSDAAWYLQEINALKPDGIYAFVRFDASKLNPVQPTWNPSTALYDIGYASLRDGFNAQAPSLFFKSGPTTNNIGHNHYDHNAFVVTYGGQWIIPDRGYHNFYIPAKRKFSLGSIGHCTVVLDVDEAYFQDQTVPSLGHDQIKRTGGKISEFFAGQHFDFVQGQAAAAYNSDTQQVLDRFDRSILYLKPDVFIIRDELAAAQPHRYNFLLHSDGNGDIAADGDHFLLSRGNGQVWAQTTSPTALTPHIEQYPGAENYGPFLRVETAPTPATTFLTVLYPRPWYTENYLRNGGFEKGMAGWLPRAGEDGPNHKIETEGMCEGKQCASIENSGYYYTERMGLPVGTNLTARVKVRTTALPEGKGATITFHFWKGGKAFTNKHVGPFRGDQWQEVELQATVPADTEQVSLALEFATPGKVWFDDVRLTTDLPRPQIITPTVKWLGNDAVEITVGATRYLVSCGPAGQTREIAGLQTDAAMAAVALTDRKPVRAFLSRGTRATYGGRELLKLAAPGDAEKALP